MRNRDVIVLGACVIAILGGVARIVVPKRPEVRETAGRSAAVDRTARSSHRESTVRPIAPRMITPPVQPRPLPPKGPAPSVGESGTEPAKSEIQSTKGEPKAIKAQAPKTLSPQPGARPGKEPIQDPVARVALAFVGADPDAEMYWYDAINDPGLSNQERQDLIEDLNEDGLSDPHNPTLEDLPLIWNRLVLIEAIAWDAMDDVNADAFQEAYKDLVNLAAQALNNG